MTSRCGDEPAVHPQPGSAEIVHREPGLAIVEVRGEHDLSSQTVLAGALEEAAAHESVLADLSGCTFADSTALAVLIQAAQSAPLRGGRFAAVIPAECRQVARVAEMIGLAELLSLHQTRDAALEALAVRPAEPA